MRAARYHGNQDIRVEDIPEPKLKAGHVMVAPSFVGICGSDLHEYLGGPIYMPSTIPHPLTGEKIPLTMGHEFSGTITAIGPNVSGSKWSEGMTVGAKVAVQPTIYDGSCGACRAGIENMCSQGGFLGLSGGGGGLSEKIVVPVANCLLLPESVPLDIGALVEPLSVAWHACEMVELGAQSRVLVIGGGPIGIACCLVLKAKGVKQTICISSKGVDYLKEFGADEVVESKGDVIGKVKKLSGGVGVDVSIDCAGYVQGMKDAITAVKSRGTVVNLALWEKPVQFNPNELMLKEAKYIGSLGYVRADFQNVIDAIDSGSIQKSVLEKMITRRIKLDDLVEEGLKRLANNKDGDVKIMVEI